MPNSIEEHPLFDSIEEHPLFSKATEVAINHYFSDLGLHTSESLYALIMGLDYPKIPGYLDIKACELLSFNIDSEDAPELWEPFEDLPARLLQNHLESMVSVLCRTFADESPVEAITNY